MLPLLTLKYLKTNQLLQSMLTRHHDGPLLQQQAFAQPHYVIDGWLQARTQGKKMTKVYARVDVNTRCLLLFKSTKEKRPQTRISLTYDPR
jgi:hypothetical protein